MLKSPAVVFPIFHAGDPVLRQVARPVTPEELRSPRLADLIAAMRETMYAAPGVGLAAPQIGEPLQLAVIENRPEYHQQLSRHNLIQMGRHPVPFHVIANPRLTVIDSGPAVFQEGCLSVPGYVAHVARALSVKVEALDHRGESVTLQASGWYARILQHEIDHLQGTLYVHRMDTRSFTIAR